MSAEPDRVQLSANDNQIGGDTLIETNQSVLGRKMASDDGYNRRNSHIPTDSISTKASFYNRNQNALSAGCNVEGWFLQATPIQPALIRLQSGAGGEGGGRGG